MSDVRSSLVLSFAEKYSGLALQIISTLILARLLTPEETGIFTVAVAMTAIAHRLRDFGMGAYLMQARDLSPERLQTTFTVSCIIAYAITAILLLSRDALAQFYDEPAMRDLLLVLSLNFMVIPIGAIPLVLLRRNMQFRSTFWISLGSGLVHFVVAVGLAWLGFGAMALAWASLAGVCATAIIASYASPIPKLYRLRLTHWREVVRFGLYSAGTHLLSEIGAKAPDLIMGRFLGFHAVGLYSRAMGVVGMFTQSVAGGISGVALPVLAKRFRDGQEAASAFLRGMEHVTVMAWPFYLLLALIAEPAVYVLLGPQWHESVPIVRILCAASAISVLGSFNWTVYQAAGAVRANFALSVFLSGTWIAFVAVAATISLKAVAVAAVFSAAIGLVASYILVNRIMGASLWKVLCAVRKSAMVAVLTMAAPVWLVIMTQDSTIGRLPLLLLTGASAGLSWLLALFILRHPFLGEVRAIAQAGFRLFAVRS